MDQKLADKKPRELLIREKPEVAAVKAFLVAMISSCLRLPPFLILPRPPFLCLHSCCSCLLPQHFAVFLLDLAEFEIDCFDRRLRAESRPGSSEEQDALCSSSSFPPLSVFPLLSSYLQLSLSPWSLLRPLSAS